MKQGYKYGNVDVMASRMFTRSSLNMSMCMFVM